MLVHLLLHVHEISETVVSAMCRPTTKGGCMAALPGVNTVGMRDGSLAVRPPTLSALHSGSEAHLPMEVERLLLGVVADGFTLHCCGPKAAPFALIASYRWEDYVDLVTIRCLDWITTARAYAPQRMPIDVFAPEAVVWAYAGPPQWALPALLELVHPQHCNAPTSAYPAPTSLHIPRAEQRPMAIRFPPAGRAGIRAARLATAMTTSRSEPVPVSSRSQQQVIMPLRPDRAKGCPPHKVLT